MKRIVHIIDNLMLGGAEVLLLTTIKKLPQFEHHVLLLTSQIHFEEIKNYAKLYFVHHAGWHTSVRTRNRLKKIIGSLQPDVIHAHLFLSSLFCRWAAGVQYNLVYSIHNLYSATVFKKPWLKYFEKITYNPNHKLIAVSKYVLNDYQKTISSCKSGHVLYNFIDDAFICDSVLTIVRPPETLNKWVAVGSFKEQKNYLGLIIQFQRFYETHQQRDMLRLDIYGDGPLRHLIEEQIKRTGLPIFLKGRANNMAEVLKNYDAYISTSHYEGYGIAPMEALAIGLALFLNDIPVYREIYKEHAFFFNAGEPGAITFSEACAAYQSMTDAERQAFSSKGRQYAVSVAGSGNYLKKLLSIYGFESGLQV